MCMCGIRYERGEELADGGITRKFQTYAREIVIYLYILLHFIAVNFCICPFEG